MLCGRCFRELNNETVCSGCGYDNTATGKYPLALASNTILNGRYITGRILGQGGFGITYLAYDHSTKEKVAVKEYFPTELATRIYGTPTVMPVSESAEEAYAAGHESFLNEARTLAQFRESGSIVRVHRYFEENGTAYLVMEYVEGIGLDRYMAAHGGRLSPEEANALLMPLMDALSYVHSKGVVHRDIAPDNILVTEDGTAKLIDFGAARYSTGEKSRSLDIILKHGFAPFEQYRRHSRQGPYTDVYALASTYYYAVTGKIIPEATERIDEDTMAEPSALCSVMWPELNEALLKGLQVRSADRYQSMTEMKSAFDAATEAENIRKAAAKKAEEKRLEKTKKTESGHEIKDKNHDTEDKHKSKVSKKLIIGAVAALLCISAVCISAPSIKRSAAYSKAEKLYESGKYEEAITAFSSLDGYKDSAAQIENCSKAINDREYARALELMNSGEYEEAIGIFSSLNGYKDSDAKASELSSQYKLKTATVGDTVTFGIYEQDNNTENGTEPIEWQVLDKQDGRILVISKYALDAQPYNTECRNVTWETCSLRKWMNDTFINEAFSTEEQVMIESTKLSADKNHEYGTNPGNVTTDKVFLLSTTEAEKYFTSDEDRMCVPTEYSVAQGAMTSDSFTKGGAATCCWWLRSPGFYQSSAAFVYLGGSVIYDGNSVNYGRGCVRPALWINLDS